MWLNERAERGGRTTRGSVPGHAQPLLAVTPASANVVTMQDVTPALLGTLMLATFAVRSIDSSAFGIKLTRICLVVASLVLVFWRVHWPISAGAARAWLIAVGVCYAALTIYFVPELLRQARAAIKK